MAIVKHFEDLEIWQKSRELTQLVYKISIKEEFAKDYGLKDQIRRASISILSNISEGFERDGNKEFITFLSYAKGYCGEVRAQLYVALDQNYIDENEFNYIHSIVIELGKMIASFISYLKSSNYKGNKFK